MKMSVLVHPLPMMTCGAPTNRAGWQRGHGRTGVATDQRVRGRSWKSPPPGEASPKRWRRRVRR